MDSKTFNTRLSKTLACEPADVARLVEGLGKILAEQATELNSVAIPGFGTFVATKTDERIVTDSATGNRTLLPPAIEIGFQTSVVLRKKLAR